MYKVGPRKLFNRTSKLILISKWKLSFFYIEKMIKMELLENTKLFNINVWLITDESLPIPNIYYIRSKK